MVDLERLGTRPIALTDSTSAACPFRGSAGQVFLTDVEGGQGWQFGPGQQVWARQFNAEQPWTKVRNVGAVLWILGLKTESARDRHRQLGWRPDRGAGGLAVPGGRSSGTTRRRSAPPTRCSRWCSPPARRQANRNYRVLVDVRRGGQRQQLRQTDVPRRAQASMVSLYNDAA